MVLNKTNANNIAFLYGEETDDWQGAEIVLFEAMVDFQGKTVPALRVRGPQKRQFTKPESGPQNKKPAQMPAEEVGDEVPF